MGGGGGGALGAPVLGMGGGGGGKASGESVLSGTGGGRDASENSASSKEPGIVGGGKGASWTGVAGLLLSCAERGLGGAMVPNRILARCFALPPAGGSSSLSLSSLSLSTLDHSSLSCRRRDCGPVNVGTIGLAASC